MGFQTNAIWKGQKPVISETSFGDVIIPIHLSSTYARKKVFELPGGYEYSRRFGFRFTKSVWSFEGLLN